MQPLDPQKKKQLTAAPQASPQKLERAELLKSLRYTRDPEEAAAPKKGKSVREQEEEELLKLDRELRPEAYQNAPEDRKQENKS